MQEQGLTPNEIESIDWIHHIENLGDPEWGDWEVIVILKNGTTVIGTMQGDGGSNYATETFEELT